MKAVAWHGKEDVRVDEVDDPRIEEATDAIVRITSTAICGSDLHLYAKLGPVMKEGDIIGHEPMGVVEEVGAAVRQIAPGDTVVIPFNIACGSCFMCERGLHSQCETTQNRGANKGASLLGYTHLYGGVPGGQAEYLRVPMAHFGPIKIEKDGVPDTRFLFLSDVLPTAWQAAEYAEIEPGETVAVWGLGPIGQMAARIAPRRGAGRWCDRRQPDSPRRGRGRGGGGRRGGQGVGDWPGVGCGPCRAPPKRQSVPTSMP